MRPMRVAAVAAVAGLVLAVASSELLGMAVADSVRLALIAGSAALLVGLLAALAAHVLRRRSFAAHLTVVVSSAVGAVVVGAVAAGQAMFLSTGDLHALVVVVAAAGAVGVLSALALARRVGMAQELLSESARLMGEGILRPGSARPTIREFAELAVELEMTAARLEDARERARAMDAARRELVSWVSHDLRTPLAGIRAVTEALEDGVVTDPVTVDRYHRTLRMESDRLAELVDDLFELSQIHAGCLALTVERVSLGDVVSDALAAADPDARRKGVRLEGRLRGPAPQVDASSRELGRVLRNLLGNAIRETPAGGTVRVEAGADDATGASVTVDDGCGGIPSEDLPRVFETAFRGQAARTPGTGSGLGLAIARGLVEAQHGTISADNLDGGCRFTVRLPLPDRQPAPQPAVS